jgi:flagellar L-ring protein precursor FlgH
MFRKHKFPSTFECTCLSCFLFVNLFGCATKIQEVRPIQQEAKYHTSEKPQIIHEGSLFQENGLLSELFINPKARRVGDVVTIKIVESSKASNKADTSTGRTSSISAGIDSFFGLENDYSPTDSFFNPFGKVKADFGSAFDGKGSTSRSGDLTAFVTARVTEVYPNGNLQIAGSREITINNERQFITLSGVIRPRDVSPDNVVLSTYISDARIAYSGAGVIDDRQRPGWMMRILNTVWPF